MKNLLAWLVLFSIILASCTSGATQPLIATATVTPLSSLTPAPTTTPSPFATQTAVATLTATQTVTPTNVPWRETIVVTPNASLHFSNPRGGYQHYPVIRTAVDGTAGDTEIRIAMAITTTENTPKDYANGIWFENTLRAGLETIKEQSNYRALFVGYQNGAWFITYVRGNEFVMYERYEVTQNKKQEFILRIDQAGENIEISTPGKIAKIYRLPQSLYDTKPTMAIVAQTSAYSSLSITQLSITQNEEIDLSKIETSASLRTLAEKCGITLGTAAGTWQFLYDPKYQELLPREFDLLVPEGEFEWNWLNRPGLDQYDFIAADQLISFADSNNMQIRAYLLPNGNPNTLPDWLTKGSYSRDEILQIAKSHIDTVMSRYKGRIREWQVASETIWDGQFVSWNFWLSRIGIDYVKKVFQWAKEADPEAILIYSFDRNEGLDAQANGVYSHIRQLKREGVPIDAVGMEMHIFANRPPRKSDVLENMKRYQEIGVKVYITEIDVNLYGLSGTTEEKLALQANIYSDMLEACLESDNCESFTLWGFSDRTSWILRPVYPYGGGESPLIFDENFEPKPAYYAIRDTLSNCVQP